MRKPTLLFRVLAMSALLLLPGIAGAQIVLNQSDASAILATGKTYDSHVDLSGASVDIGYEYNYAQTWDFTGRNYGSLTREMYLSAASTPFNSLFPSASLASYVKDSNSSGKYETWTYGQLTATDYVNAGSVTRVSGTAHDTTLVDSLRPAQSALKFPLQYNLSWNYNAVPKLTDLGQGIQTRSTKSVAYVVDAFGTVSVPGKTFDALRLKTTEIDSTETIFNGYSYGTQVTTVVSYLWIGRDGSSASATVSPAVVVSYSTPSTGASSVEPVPFNGPTAFSLGQNYPNPFNPSTNIEFGIRNAGQTTLRVFNILGQEVATLVDRYLPAGRYRVNFNANDLASGLYIYSIESGENRTARKMILMK
ncbi:MAG: T9SS type A sorting domain-containing protein [Bacteroidota bacterium]